MNRLLFVFLLFMLFCSVGYTQNRSIKPEKINNSYYIVENNQTYKIDDKIILAKLNLNTKLKEGIKGSKASALGVIRISIPDSIELTNYMSYLEQTGDFEILEYNGYYKPYFIPNDFYCNDQWYLDTIKIKSAWDITTGSSSIKVAVIDNGTSANHPDLCNNLCPYDGFDYINNTSPATIGDRHGTAMAGLIGASTNNTIGIAGIAGGNDSPGVKIIPYRTDYTYSQILYAFEDAIEKGARVINMSFGGGYSALLSQAMTNAYNNGVTIVCASGNNNQSNVDFPASHNCTIAVGASDKYNNRAIFNNLYSSNYGTGLDLVAPGDSIISTDYYFGYNYYRSSSGTSLATPQVSGVAALMLSVNPSLTPFQIKNIFHNTCTKISSYSYDASGWNNEVGYGLLNAYAAVYVATDPKIVGNTYTHLSNTYYLDNLPSGYTVEWSLSDSYYNQNCLQQNYPSQNQCRITCDFQHDMMNATLTATIKYNGDTIHTVTRSGLYAYNDFRGQYTSGNLSGNIDYTHIFTVRPNVNTYITSAQLIGATASYSNTGTTPYSWGFSSQYGELQFVMPSNNNGIPVIINVDDICGNHYQLYAMPQNSKNLNICPDDNGITVILEENGETSEDKSSEQSWTVEISNALTGKLMDTRSATSRSLSVSTNGWPKGLYVVKAAVGKEIMTEKVMVK